MDFKNTQRVLEEFGRLGVERSQGELKITRKIRGRSVNRVATGNLRDSIYYQVLQEKRDFFVKFDVQGTARRYASFIHEGVNGTELSVGSPYSFKSRFVNISAIERYIRDTPDFRLRKVIVNKYGQRINTFVEKSEQNIKSAAYVIARSIAKKGIVGVPFLDAGTEWAFDKIQRDLENAWEQDSLDFLELE